MSPLTARAAPQRMAVNACGRRDWRTMKRQLALMVSSPERMARTSRTGILIEPMMRFSQNSKIISAVSPMQYFSPLPTLSVVNLKIITQWMQSLQVGMEYLDEIAQQIVGTERRLLVEQRLCHVASIDLARVEGFQL